MARNFDLNLLPVLVAIYDHGGATAAAAHLNLSQSAVSTILGRLRLKYGDPLFYRTAHGMQPTGRMRELIQPLREILARVEGTLASGRQYDPRTTQHTFTLAMTDLGEMVFLPKLLARVRELAPAALVRTVVDTAGQIERGLEVGEIDLAIGYFPDLRDKAFLEKHLLYHDFVCLLRADHPVTSATLSLAQFRGLEHAVVDGAGRTYEMFERFLKSKRIQRRVVLRTPHFMSIPFVIAQSDLIVTVPHTTGAFATKLNINIRVAQPPLRTPRIDLKMHWHRNFQRDPQSRWLRQLVASLFTDELDEWQVRKDRL